MNIRILSLAALGLVSTIAIAPPAQAQTAPNYNYVGIGVAAGEVGDRDFGLAVNGKVNLGDNVSLRPGIISDLDFGDDGETTFLAPVTYDFNAITDNGKLFPYLGGGVAVLTGEDSDVGPLLTAGVDYRATDNIILNGGVNWSIYDDSQINGVVAIGYTF